MDKSQNPIIRKELFFDIYVREGKDKFTFTGTRSFNLDHIISIKISGQIYRKNGLADISFIEIYTDVPSANFEGFVDYDGYMAYLEQFES